MTPPATYENSYRLLAACFYPPTTALLDEGCCSSVSALLAPCVPEAAAHAAKAAQLLQDAPLESHLVEYSRLFLGPFKLVAPPYGSVWLDTNKTVMGDSTARVAAFYQAHGLQLADDFSELPDHIAVELEFLSFLCFKEQEAARQNDTAGTQLLRAARQEFISELLLPWLQPLTEAIDTDSEAPFYSAVARCTHALVKTDLAELQESVDA